MQNNWRTLNAEESLIGNARRMVGSWGAVPWLVRTRNVSYESMATWGSRPQDGKTGGFVFSFAEKEKKQSKR